MTWKEAFQLRNLFTASYEIDLEIPLWRNLYASNNIWLGTKAKKQKEIDFGLEFSSDSDCTIDNREEVPDDPFFYFESEDVSTIDHTEVVP